MAFTFPAYETLEEILIRIDRAATSVMLASDAVSAALVQEENYRKTDHKPSDVMTEVQQLLATVDDFFTDMEGLVAQDPVYTPTATASKYTDDVIAYIEIVKNFDDSGHTTLQAYDADDNTTLALDFLAALDTIEIKDSALSDNDGEYTVQGIDVNGCVTLTSDVGGGSVAKDTTVKVMLRDR